MIVWFLVARIYLSLVKADNVVVLSAGCKGPKPLQGGLSNIADLRKYEVYYNSKELLESFSSE